MGYQVSKVLYDTTVLIDAFNGIQEVTSELAHWDVPTSSGITLIEVTPAPVRKMKRTRSTHS